MAEPTTDFFTLRDEIRKMKGDIAQYEQQARISGGFIDDVEQAILDQMNADLDKAEAHLQTLIDNNPDSPKQPQQTARERVRELIETNWRIDLTEQEAIKLAQDDFGGILNDEMIKQVYQEIADERNIFKINPDLLPEQPESEPEEPENPELPSVGDHIGETLGNFADDLSDLRYIEYKCGGTKISIDLLGEAKVKQKITAALSIEIKINSDVDLIASLKYNHQEKVYIELKGKYNPLEQKASVGIYASNLEEFFKKAPPEGIAENLRRHSAQLEKALTKLKKDPMDEEARKKASKAITAFSDFMTGVKDMYSQAPTFSVGVEMILPTGGDKDSPVYDSLPPSEQLPPAFGVGFIMRFWSTPY